MLEFRVKNDEPEATWSKWRTVEVSTNANLMLQDILNSLAVKRLTLDYSTHKIQYRIKLQPQAASPDMLFVKRGSTFHIDGVTFYSEEDRYISPSLSSVVPSQTRGKESSPTQDTRPLHVVREGPVEAAWLSEPHLAVLRDIKEKLNGPD